MSRIIVPYFPIGIKYTTPLLIAVGVYLFIIGYPIWIGVMALLSIIILTTSYVTEINIDKKELRDFLSFLWMPFQVEIIKFNKAEKIIITKVNHSQVLNSQARSRQLDWSSFTGTLLTDNNKTLDLLTRTEKRALIKGLKEFAELLNVDIEDHTTSEYFKIDLNKY